MSTRNKGVSEAARLKDKDAARLQDALTTAKNVAWVDRMAKEMKAQREWSDKWGVLNDTQLYIGDMGTPVPAAKATPTKWSAYSIINTPKRNPLASRPSTSDVAKEEEEEEDDGTFNSFKVTGNRHDFLSCNNARHPNHPNPTKRGMSRTSDVEVSSYDADFGGQLCYDHRTGLYGRVSNQYKPGFSNSTTIPKQKSSSHGSHETGNHAAGARKFTHQQASLASFNHVANQPLHRPSAAPAYLKGGMTFTKPLSSKAPAQQQHSYNVRQKGVPAELPADKYLFPPTSNMEYGWTYQNRKTLEIFGSTSADFTKESWKRAQATQQS
ncbi:hypothetical protein CcCBS67573_g04575 [Chytriomyces confervae]|uniref:Uncharacterized protein n=1 Tax=Chytriomyces confervae TaxID=246404 RepID=A0A507FDE8_9FUNG|nr:hypothetical protein CcCBS67573_g04575 [Chytriomyces confervae]